MFSEPFGTVCRSTSLATSRTSLPKILSAVAVGTVLALGALTNSAAAAIITTADIIKIPAGITGSGNGTLDYLLMTQGTDENRRNSIGLNLDDASDLFAGGTSTEFAESFVTSGLDLKTFYNVNFGYTMPGEVEIVLFLDLQETGAGEQVNSLDKLDIYKNPATINGVTAGTGAYDPVGTDGVTGEVDAANQSTINQTFTGGTLIAFLSPEPADNLDARTTGGGFADFIIFTGIDPFLLNDGDIILFNISMSLLTGGGEAIFLSGEIASGDVCPETRVQCDLITNQIPEPSTLALFGIGLVGLGLFNRRRRKSDRAA